MRLVVQRVSKASVEVDGQVVGSIAGPGLLVLCGVRNGDTDADADKLADKVWNLRILAEERSCAEEGAPLLVVSQFTLYADVRRGNRPSFTDAAPPECGEAVYEAYVEALRAEGAPVATGVFGAHMRVELVNDGPVTILLEA